MMTPAPEMSGITTSDADAESHAIWPGNAWTSGTTSVSRRSQAVPQTPLPRAIRIRVPLESSADATVDDLHALFLERKGEAKVLFDVERQGDFMVVMEAEGYNVLPDRNFIARVEELCGRGSVRVIS